jgi:hypothetical protein
MSEAQAPTQPQPRPGFFLRELHYVLLLILAVIGIAYTSLSPDTSVAYGFRSGQVLTDAAETAAFVAERALHRCVFGSSGASCHSNGL